MPHWGHCLQPSGRCLSRGKRDPWPIPAPTVAQRCQVLIIPPRLGALRVPAIAVSRRSPRSLSFFETGAFGPRGTAT
jgi:hypothetical protein